MALELVGLDLDRQPGDLLERAHGSKAIDTTRNDPAARATADMLRPQPVAGELQEGEQVAELDANAGAGLKALGLNCTLKKSPEVSHTEALMGRVLSLLSEHGTETEMLRPVDYAIAFGVTSDEGDGDEWPQILDKIKAADILLMGMSIWFGHRSSVAQLVIERLDGTYNERNEVGPVPALQQGRGRGGDRQRGRRPRLRRVDPVQHDPPGLRGAAQRRHLLGRRRRPRSRPTSTPAAPSTRTRSGPARGAPTTSCTWRGSFATARSPRSATRWRSTAATRCMAGSHPV